MQLRTEDEVTELERRQQEEQQMQFDHPDLQQEQPAANVQAEQQAQPETYVRRQPKIGRNDPCHCGSGKKYKQCHGKLS